MDDSGGGSCAGCLVVVGGAMISAAVGLVAWLLAFDRWGRAQADLLAGAAFCVVFLVVCWLMKEIM